jgi:hypothetical protein
MASCPALFRARRWPARNRTQWHEGWGPVLPEILTMTAPNLASGWPTGGTLRVPWYSQTPLTTNLPYRTSPPEETLMRPPRKAWRRRSATPAWRQSAAPSSTMSAPAGVLRQGLPMARSRPASLLRLLHRPQPSQARRGGLSVTPREYPCKNPLSLNYLFPNSFLLPPPQGRRGEEGREDRGE